MFFFSNRVVSDWNRFRVLEDLEGRFAVVRRKLNGIYTDVELKKKMNRNAYE